MGSYDAFKPEAYPGSKTALLFLDYQNVLVNMIQDPEKKNKLIESAKTLLTTARKHQVAIVHCVMDTKTDPPPTNKVSEQWATVHKPALSAIPELAAEYSELAPDPASAGGLESTSFRAPGYRSALVGKGLLSLLREELKVEHLILGGIATSGAILGTASHATDLDFVVTVVEDACWDPDDSVHLALIKTVLPTLAWVSTVDEAVTRLSS
jgi:nicotinamidase-related amidase